MNADVMRYILPNFLEFGDLLNFSMVDKNSYRLLKNSLFAKRERTLNKLKTKYPTTVLDTVGINHLLFGEEVVWNNSWLGATQYIDRVRPKHLSSTFSYGEDLYNRSFIFYKTDQGVMVLFQRYTNGEGFVAIDPLNVFPDVIDSRCYLSAEFAADLKIFFKSI
jgi:hypothetical protein